mmetsp:Transcript_17091/g.46976  ORF Transcript_17091/g.46976 Transcript_17091/m.46976 type:complete len:239 (+) Transcript_17091:1278-1994(+)
MLESSRASFFSFAVRRSVSRASEVLLKRRLRMSVTRGPASPRDGGMHRYRNATMCSGSIPCSSRCRMAFGLAENRQDRPSSQFRFVSHARCRGNRPSVSPMDAASGSSSTSLVINSCSAPSEDAAMWSACQPRVFSSACCTAVGNASWISWTLLHECPDSHARWIGYIPFRSAWLAPRGLYSTSFPIMVKSESEFFAARWRGKRLPSLTPVRCRTASSFASYRACACASQRLPFWAKR